MKQILALVIVACGIWFGVIPKVNQYYAAQSTPDVRPTEMFGFDQSIPPVVKDDRSAAMVISGVCEGLADCIEVDTSLKYVSNIQELRKATLNLALGDKSIKERCPKFGEVVGVVFQKELPTDDQPLTPEGRKKAVALFRAVGYAARTK